LPPRYISILQKHIERVSAIIREAIYHKKTSDNQLYRLLNPKILKKNLEQLYKIVYLLGLEIEIEVKKSA